MLIGSLRLKWISDEKGYGLFASEPIPKGTILYVKDKLDIVISPAEYQDMLAHQPLYHSIMEKYSYEDSKGQHIVCWDLGKYMNHCCFSNSLSTGYEVEIAIADIPEGEEVTDDYRIISSTHDISQVNCSNKDCLLSIQYEATPELVARWDQDIQSALKEIHNVKQPLWELMPQKTIQQIESFLKDPKQYISVKTQLPY